MRDYEMVQELAKLAKSNFQCKYLVLSVEEKMIKFLNNDTSPDGIMELQPMNSYNRLLMHRLAEIFGFSHESIGEDDERRIILKRCPETSIPSMLVSDILGQYDYGEDDDDDNEDDDDDYPTTTHARKRIAVGNLALKVKDNLQGKHLVLSMEKVLIDFIEDDTRSNGIMNLQPMDTYSRHIIHLLAEIFGFLHRSVGEGAKRHMVLTWQPETSVPSVLVSDILCQNEDHHHPTTSPQLLRRTEDSAVSKTSTPDSKQSLKEREAAYMAARERIFSKDENDTKESSFEQKPRTVPVVAQRMIAHALGQRIKPSNSGHSTRETTPIFQEEDEVTSKVKVVVKPETTICESSKSVELSPNIKDGSIDCKDDIKGKQMGAAKRLFAHAMGFSPTKDRLVAKKVEAKEEMDTE